MFQRWIDIGCGLGLGLGLPSRGSQEVDNVTQPGAQLSGMFHVGITVLHHPAVEPPVADVSPTPHPKKLMLRIAWLGWPVL